jgi:hypothetical protein
LLQSFCAKYLTLSFANHITQAIDVRAISIKPIQWFIVAFLCSLNGRIDRTFLSADSGGFCCVLDALSSSLSHNPLLPAKMQRLVGGVTVGGAR